MKDNLPATKNTNLAVYDDRHDDRQISFFSNIRSFEDGQRMAAMLSKSLIIPKNYQNNVADCFLAMELAVRLQTSPFVVMQNTYVIDGKPSFSAQFVIGKINSCGRFSPLRFKFDGDGDDYHCFAYAKDLETGETVNGPKVSIRMAKGEGWWSKKNKYGKECSKWQTMPELMMQYRAGSFFSRMYIPDLFMGMSTTEELIDMHQTGDAGVYEAKEAVKRNVNVELKFKDEEVEGVVVETDENKDEPPVETKPEPEKKPAPKKEAKKKPAPKKEAPKKEEEPPVPEEQPSDTTDSNDGNSKDLSAVEKGMSDYRDKTKADLRLQLDNANSPAKLAAWKEEITKTITDLLPLKTDRDEIKAYFLYRQHQEDILEMTDIDSINEWADAKLISIQVDLDSLLPYSAKDLIEQLKETALDRIHVIKVESEPQESVDEEEFEDSDPEVEALKYSKECQILVNKAVNQPNSDRLNKWNAAVAKQIGELSDKEKEFLFNVIATFREELEAIEREEIALAAKNA